MITYRIVHHSVADLLLGSGHDSRWFSEGRKVIYTSNSIALACLENILRRTGKGFSTDFKTIFYEISDDIEVEEILLKELRANWKLRSSYPYCQNMGNLWHDSANAEVLKVPSAIIPEENNYIIKTPSPAIRRIKIIEERPFAPDERLDKLLLSVDSKKLKK
jgi:RES domain-containing protein